MTPLSRREYYASLPPARHGRGRAWTPARALTALRLFIHEEHSYPGQKNLSASEWMPSPATVACLFGSLRAYRALVPRSPGRRSGPRPARKPLSPYAHTVACMQCERDWPSPDKRFFHICPTCQAKQTETEDGSWMTGEPVVLNGVPDFETWEDDEADEDKDIAAWLRHKKAALN